MNLILHISWLLILHLPVYSQASNHAESSFRVGPDFEYKYGTVPKRKDKRIHHLRAYDTNQRKWKLKNFAKPKIVFIGQNQEENRKHSVRGYILDELALPKYAYTIRVPRFTITRRRKRTKTHMKPTSEPTTTPNHEEKPTEYDSNESWTTTASNKFDDEDEEENLHRPRYTTTEPHRPRHTTTEPHRPRQPHRPKKPRRPRKPHRPRHTTTEPPRPRHIHHTTTDPRPEVTTQTTPTTTTHKSSTRTHARYTTKRSWFKAFKDKISSLWSW